MGKKCLRALEIFPPWCRTDSATNGILSQYARSPLAELRGTDIVDAIAYADNGIEVVKLSHIVFAVRSSCRDFLGN